MGPVCTLYRVRIVDLAEAQNVSITTAWRRSCQTLSPRAAMGLRLWVSGACPTMKEAAASVGMSPMALSYAKHTPAGQTYIQSAMQTLNEQVIEHSVLMDKLSKRAIGVIANLMENSKSEALQLKAAQDLADRGPETSKVQKHQIESFTLSGRDAKDLAEALVRSKQVASQYSEQAKSDTIKVELNLGSGSTESV